MHQFYVQPQIILKWYQIPYYARHSKESNCISEFGVARQNWCILSIYDKIKKFSIFSEVYENNIFETLEPKLEPSEFTIPFVRALKSEKSMFFKPISLKIIQKLIFKLWIEQDDSWADFDIHKWSLFWSHWSSAAKNTLKIWVKLKLNFFQTI